MRRKPIIQGEFAVVTEPDVAITTLLGSCISVCLHDAQAHVGGMNHFLLGEPRVSHRVRAEDMHRYGIHAMELLINAMMQKGAARHRLRAYVFGGGNIQAAFSDIGSRNGEFALRFLRTEGIPVIQSEIGGTQARKVEFVGWSGEARCVRLAIAAAPIPPSSARARTPARGGDVELFA